MTVYRITYERNIEATDADQAAERLLENNSCTAKPEFFTDKEEATMEAFAAVHGYSWRAAASGNVLYYRTASGKEYSIPQERLMHTWKDELREAIAAAGLNLKQAAEECGVPYRTMQDWRAGRRTPPNLVRESVLAKLAAVKKDA